MRLAVLSWRLWRVVRYEAEVSTAAVSRTEADMEKRYEYSSEKPLEPASAREKSRSAAVVIRTLKALAKLPDEKSLDRESAVTTLWALSRELPDDRESLSVPGIPDEDAEFDAFDQWTAGLLRKATEVYAAAARITVEACSTSASRPLIRTASRPTRKSGTSSSERDVGTYFWSGRTVVERSWSRKS